MKKQRHSEGKSESLVCVGCVAFSHLFSTKDVGRIWALDCAGQSKLLTELLGKASADAARSLMQPEIFNAEHFLLCRSGRSDAQQLSGLSDSLHSCRFGGCPPSSCSKAIAVAMSWADLGRFFQFQLSSFGHVWTLTNRLFASTLLLNTYAI